MLLLHCSPRLLLRLSPSHSLPASSSSSSSFSRSTRRSVAVRADPEPLSTSVAEPPPAAVAEEEYDDGPVELRGSTLFSVDENPSTLQVATSVLLTGAITVFLFRSLRRRARRAKELRVRSTGVEKPRSLSEEALESLRMVSATPIEANKPPSPVQVLLGGIAAGVIAVILYKFTTTIEAALNRQTISDNFSVRQITITVRTFVNGICYLATFAFGINAVGLTLYALQLTFASIMDDDPSSPGEKISEQSNTIASSNTSTSDKESTSSDLQQISDESKNSTE